MPSSGTSQRLEIFCLSSHGIGRSERHTIASGWMPRPAQLGDGVLGELGLLLPRRRDVGNERDVHVEHVVAPDVFAELPDRLEEGQDLDVADGAADLGDHDVDGLVGGEGADPLLDLVGDVRDHLHGVAEVVAAALLGEHLLVDRPGGGVRPPRERHVDEALVVPEVEVGLAAVVGDEHLAVLEGVHRAGVDVDVGVELLHRDPQTPGLEQPPEGGGSEPLAEARCHATGHEDVLCQDPEFSRATTAKTTAGDRTMRPPKPRAPLPCPSMTATAMPSAAVASQARRLWRIDALVLGVVAVVLRLPAFFATRSLVFDDGVLRVVGAGDAQRPPAVPRRVLEPGAGVPPARVARRPARVPHARRAAPAHRSRPGVLLTIAVYSCARRVTTRGHALLAAGLVTTSGSVLWVTGAGQRRRPVARAVGARDRLGAARARPRAHRT